MRPVGVCCFDGTDVLAGAGALAEHDRGRNKVFKMDAPVLVEVGKAHATKVEVSHLKRPVHKKKMANSKQVGLIYNSMLGHQGSTFPAFLHCQCRDTLEFAVTFAVTR